jgi:outer membrane cobalamin receptor
VPVLRNVLITIMIAGSLIGDAHAQQSAKDSQGLSSLTIEDLMNIKVTSVSKKEEKLARTAAAVFVITQEDIRRSGATNVPDLLRMVPGLDVAQINGSTYAIGSRGFNQQYANKLLVMVDGRSVYSPTFSGVFWDTLDLPLFDIDRIEVIRGPGGSIWGANAVTGVISIFTKKAADTRGTLVEAGAGTIEQDSEPCSTVEPPARTRTSESMRIILTKATCSIPMARAGQTVGTGCAEAFGWTANCLRRTP